MTIVTTPELDEGFAAALAAIPIFPLPGMILFPGTGIPLHIFEARYRALLAHCLATHQALVLAPILAGPEDAHGHPPIPKIVGGGVIVQSETEADGKGNILVVGKGRLLLEELPFEGPFRRGKAILLEDEESSDEEKGRRELYTAVSGFVSDLKRKNADFQVEFPADAPLGLYTDLVASALVAEPRVQQQLLETISVDERIERLVDVLGVQRLALRDAPAGNKAN